MVKELVCMKNGRCFDRYISGTLDNPEQRVLVAVTGKVENSDFVTVIPAEDTDIRWTDEHGDSHVSHLHKNTAFAVLPEFLEEEPLYSKHTLK